MQPRRRAGRMQQTLKAGRQQAFKASRHEALNTGWRTCETFNRGRDGRYAPDASFVCWNFHPPAGLDVWSFWGRLCDRDVAFSPQSHRGVFPLLFLKAQATTGTAMFIAIGNDEADVAHLKASAEEALRELPVGDEAHGGKAEPLDVIVHQQPDGSSLLFVSCNNGRVQVMAL